jgi:hypothetical protein
LYWCTRFTGGVGGPAREIARFAEVHVTGINNNQYQVTRANDHTRRLGMESMCTFVKGDFMKSMSTSSSSSSSSSSSEKQCVALC